MLEVLEWNELRALASEALGGDCVRAERFRRGGNNAVMKLIMEDGRAFVAKQYLADERRRLQREFDMLRVLHACRIHQVPEPMARWDDKQLAIYTYIEGEHKDAIELTDEDLEQILSYLLTIQSIRKSDISIPLMPADWAVFSVADAIANVRRRIERSQESAPDEHVTKFLQHVPVLSSVQSALSSIENRIGSENMMRRIAFEDECLSSVDMGTHNFLWSADGSLHVLDFEYGGWDHPLRVVADLMAHDKMRGVSRERKAAFLESYLRRSIVSSSVLEDIETFCELAQIEWLMIRLNALQPEKILHRAQQQGDDFHRESYIAQQLQTLEACYAEWMSAQNVSLT